MILRLVKQLIFGKPRSPWKVFVDSRGARFRLMCILPDPSFCDICQNSLFYREAQANTEPNVSYKLNVCPEHAGLTPEEEQWFLEDWKQEWRTGG